MNISSRTPDGAPNQCPICRAEVVVDAALLLGDATCSQCGTLLFFFTNFEGERVFVPEEQLPNGTQRFRERIAELLGVDVGRLPKQMTDEFFSDLGADSLDMVELVMELEEEFNIDIDDDGNIRFD